MQEAFQSVLDWIAPCDFDSTAEYTEGIIRLLRDFPLHEYEFRMVLERLGQAMRHLIVDEQMNLWQAVGHT